MTIREQIFNTIEAFKSFEAKFRYLMIVTNNNLVDREMHVTPIKRTNEIAILTLVVYSYGHIGFIKELDLTDLSGILLDIETKNGINVFNALYNLERVDTVIPVLPSNLVKKTCENYVDYSMWRRRTNRALVYGTGNLAKRVATSLMERNIFVDFYTRKSADSLKSELESYSIEYKFKEWGLRDSPNEEDQYDLIFSCYPGIKVNELTVAKKFILGALNFDVGGNGYSNETIHALRKMNNPVIHISIDEALFAWLKGIQSADSNMRSLSSAKLDCGHTYVVMGQALVPGEIGVDSLPNPTRIYGQRTSTGGFTNFNCVCKR